MSGLLPALVAVAVVGLAASSGTSAAVGTTFTVDTTDGAYDGICGSAHCSLSDAIWEANANAGKDTIAFNIPGTGPHVIVLPALGTPLPARFIPSVSDAVVIDGTTEPGYAGTPLIEIDGNGRFAVLAFSGDETSGSEVRGLAINNTLHAIQLNNPGGNIVERNFIGTDASGTVAKPMPPGFLETGIEVSNGLGPAASLGNTVADNLIAGIRGNAISLDGASDSHVLRNLIGTDLSGKIQLSTGSGDGIRIVGDRNDVSGNVVAGVERGIRISGSTNDASTDNRIEGNFVGTDIEGKVDLGNCCGGISIEGAATSNIVGGSSPASRNVISGNGGIGLQLGDSPLAVGNVAEGNFIGTDVSGTLDHLGNDGAGIQVSRGTDHLIARNVVSGNGGNGVVAGTTTTLSVRIESNFIGTNAQGTAPIPNDGDGVMTQSGVGASLVSVIGGETAAQRNIISGNRGNGVSVGPFEADGVEVLNNYIGTDVTGMVEVGNQGHGVEAAGSGLVIGKLGAGNLISGNGGAGVHLRYVDTLVQTNLIGTDVSGTSDLGNGGAGILGSSSYGDVRIGGPADGEGNLISGNRGWGIELGSAGVGANVIQRNRIGTDVTGATAIANSAGGVTVAQLNGMSNIVENVIKGNGGHGVRLANRVGSNRVLRNLISGNAGDGVQVLALIERNAILTNSIFENAGLGIDLILNDDGVTPNDPGDLDGGPNLRQNFPVITEVGAGGTTIAGTLNSRPNSTYIIELFENAECDPSGFGEGETLLTPPNNPPQVTTDGLGNASFSVPLVTPVQPGTVVTATATDAESNTSEFSQCKAPPPTATIVVKKETEPNGSSEEFSFTGDAAGTIGDDETLEVSVTAPGTYTSTEAVPAGWDLKAIACGDSDSSGAVGSATATFRVAPNETVTCTFTNTKRGTIVVEKLTIPDGAPGGFSFTGDAAGTLSDNGRIIVQDLRPGRYSSTEATASDWALTGIGCSDTNSSGDLATRTATFDLDPGETVTCTFTNRLDVKPPTCVIDGQGKTPTGRTFIRFRVQDLEGGLARYVVTYTRNATVTVESFVPSACLRSR